MSKDSKAVITELLQNLETVLLQPHVRRSPLELSNLLAENFREFASSGRIYSKQDVLAALSTESNADWSISDFTTDLLGNGLALVTYRAIKRTATVEIVSLRSSLWIVDNGQWQMLFHQGTNISPKP